MFDTICVDYGKISCGIAIGDSRSKLVLPQVGNTIPPSTLLEHIEMIAHKYPITYCIVGYPTRFSGDDTSLSGLINTFLHQAEDRFPDVIFNVYNENNSTKKVKQEDKKISKSTIDHLSASTILQDYFHFTHS